MSEHSGEQEIPSKETGQPRLNEVAQKFLADLDEERRRIGEEFPLCSMLIDEAFDRIYTTGRIPGKEYHADVYKQKPMKITQKVFVPTKQFPKFNFTGKILGPNANSLRRLQEETQCKIAIKGRNSMRDRKKEEDLRNSDEPRYSHLNKDLFLEISTVAPPAESYARIAYALAEIRKFLVPDKNDEVSQDQLREMMEINPQAAKQAASTMQHLNRSVLDRKIGNNAPGVSKYQNLLKQTIYQQEEEVEEPEEEEEEMYEYPRNARRAPPTYEYGKERPMHSAPTFKREPPSPYATDVKRLRGAPSKAYVKPTSFSILKKYK